MIDYKDLYSRSEHYNQLLNELKSADADLEQYKKLLAEARKVYDGCEKRISRQIAETIGEYRKCRRKEIDAMYGAPLRAVEKVGNNKTEGIRDIVSELENAVKKETGNLEKLSDEDLKKQLIRNSDAGLKKIAEIVEEIEKALQKHETSTIKKKNELDNLRKSIKNVLKNMSMATPEETQGAMASELYLLPNVDNENSDLDLTKIEHKCHPTVFTYNSDEVKGIGVNECLQDFIVRLLEGLYLSNAIACLKISIIDVVSGAKKFLAPPYDSLVTVYEKDEKIRLLVEQIEKNVNMIAKSSMTLAELNKKRIEDHDPLYPYHVVFFIIPPLESIVNSHIINTDLWRLMDGCEKYGFFPLFFIEESDWENGERDSTLNELRNRILPENIYAVDLQNNCIRKQVETWEYKVSNEVEKYQNRLKNVESYSVDCAASSVSEDVYDVQYDYYKRILFELLPVADFKDAIVFCNMMSDIKPEEAINYVYRFMITNSFSQMDNIEYYSGDLGADKDIILALQLSEKNDPELHRKLLQYIENNKQKQNNASYERVYKAGLKLMDEQDYYRAEEQFEKILDYKDSAEKYNECEYQRACEYMEWFGLHWCKAARDKFRKLGDYKDSSERAKECSQKIKKFFAVIGGIAAGVVAIALLIICLIIPTVISKKTYPVAQTLFVEKRYEEALKKFKNCGSYEDTKLYKERCYLQLGVDKVQKGEYKEATKYLKKIKDTKAVEKAEEFTNLAGYVEAVSLIPKLLQYDWKINGVIDDKYAKNSLGLTDTSNGYLISDGDCFLGDGNTYSGKFTWKFGCIQDTKGWGLYVTYTSASRWTSAGNVAFLELSKNGGKINVKMITGKRTIVMKKLKKAKRK